MRDTCSVTSKTTLGSLLRDRRRALGLTQADVAERIGHRKPNRVSQWERDEERPSAANLKRLITALDIDADQVRSVGGPWLPHAPRLTRRQREQAHAASAPADNADELVAVGLATDGGVRMLADNLWNQLTAEQQRQVTRQCLALMLEYAEANAAAGRAGRRVKGAAE